MFEFHLVLGLAYDLGPIGVIVRYKHLIALVQALCLSLLRPASAHHTSAESASAAGTLCADVIPVQLDGIDGSLVSQINREELTGITCSGSPAGLEILIQSLGWNIVLKC